MSDLTDKQNNHLSNDLLARAARIGDSDQTGSCPPRERLQAYQALTLTADEAEEIDEHLGRCARCRDLLVQLTYERDPSLIASQLALWRSSIGVALLGPADAPHRPLKRAADELTRGRGVCLEEDDHNPYVVWDTSAAEDGSDPIDGRRLSALVRKTLETVAGTKIGAFITAGRGYIRGDVPFGAAIDEALAQERHIIPGVVRVHIDLADYLEPLGIRLKSLSGAAFLEVDPIGPAPVHPGDLIREWGRKVFGWSAGTLQFLSGGIELVVIPQPARRSLIRDMPPPEGRALVQGDRLAVKYQVPGSSWVYLLLQSRQDLSLPVGSAPIRTPDDPPQGEKRIVLDPIPGAERPLLLVTPAEVHGLAIAVAKVNNLETSPDEDRPRRLVRLLRTDFGVEEMLLVHAGSFDHQAAPRIEAPSELVLAREATGQTDYPRALEALAVLLRRSLPAEFEAEAQLLLGSIKSRQGDMGAAKEALSRAETLASEMGDQGMAGDAALELAWCACHTGELDGALAALERARSRHRSCQDAIGEAKDDQCLAAIHWSQGRFYEAYETYSRVLEPAHMAREARLEACAREGLGQVDQDLGRLDEAASNFEAALTVFRKIGDRRGEMRVLGDLGQLEADRGRHANALHHFQQQLDLAKQLGNPEMQLLVELSIGRAFTALGRFDEGRQRLLAILPGFLQRGRTDQAAFTRMSLAELELTLHRFDEAARWLEAIGEVSHLPLVARWRVALARGRWRELTGHPDAEREYLTGIESVEAERASLPSHLRVAVLRITVALFEHWIAFLARTGATAEYLLEAVERARARALLDALSRAERTDSGPGMPQASLFTAGALPLHQILDRLSGQELLLETFCLEDRILLFRVTSSGIEMRSVDLDRARLERLCGRARELCANPDPVTSGQPLPEVLAELSGMLLEPIRDWLEGLAPDTPIGLIPHGPLHELPVHALPWRRRDSLEPVRPLIVSHPVFYLPSLRAIGHWLMQPPVGTHGALVMANAIGDLAHATDEGRNVIRRLGFGDLYAGAAASARVLKQEAPLRRLIHLATHAWRSRSGAPAAIQLACRSRTAGPLEGALSREAAALLGRFEVGQIKQLTLDAELVVLSACETGAGEVTEAGDGPELLSWAFLGAGARAVIASGWEVDDAATAWLMGRFYAALCSGCSRVEALARAQREWLTEPGRPVTAGSRGGLVLGDDDDSRSDRQHPYFWAAFSLMGDWREGGLMSERESQLNAARIWMVQVFPEINASRFELELTGGDGPITLGLVSLRRGAPQRLELATRVEGADPLRLSAEIEPSTGLGHLRPDDGLFAVVAPGTWDRETLTHAVLDRHRGAGPGAVPEDTVLEVIAGGRLEGGHGPIHLATMLPQPLLGGTVACGRQMLVVGTYPDGTPPEELGSPVELRRGRRAVVSRPRLVARSADHPLWLIDASRLVSDDGAFVKVSWHLQRPVQETLKIATIDPGVPLTIHFPRRPEAPEAPALTARVQWMNGGWQIDGVTL